MDERKTSKIVLTELNIPEGTVDEELYLRRLSSRVDFEGVDTALIQEPTDELTSEKIITEAHASIVKAMDEGNFQDSYKARVVVNELTMEDMVNDINDDQIIYDGDTLIYSMGRPDLDSPEELDYVLTSSGHTLDNFNFEYKPDLKEIHVTRKNRVTIVSDKRPTTHHTILTNVKSNIRNQDKDNYYALHIATEMENAYYGKPRRFMPVTKENHYKLGLENSDVGGFYLIVDTLPKLMVTRSINNTRLRANLIDDLNTTTPDRYIQRLIDEKVNTYTKIIKEDETVRRNPALSPPLEDWEIDEYREIIKSIKSGDQDEIDFIKKKMERDQSMLSY